MTSTELEAAFNPQRFAQASGGLLPSVGSRESIRTCQQFDSLKFLKFSSKALLEPRRYRDSWDVSQH